MSKTSAQSSTLLKIIMVSVIVAVISIVVAFYLILVAIVISSLFTTVIDEYAWQLREKYSETLTRYRDPDINKFPAAGPSVHGYVPFIPLISIIMEKHNKKFLHSDKIEKKPEFEKIKIDDILKPLTDKPLRFVLIEGEPGIGKSTLAKKLSLRWVRQTDEFLTNYKIVILIPLRLETYQKAENIEDLLIDVEGINKTEVMSSINETRGAGVLWILDGFDELPHHLRSNSTSIFIKLIKGDILSKSTVIVTSRHAATEPLLTFLEDDSKHIALRGFGYNETILYAFRFFKDEKIFYEFYSYYRGNAMIENMLYNPMNCFIICTIFNDFILTNNTKYPRTMTAVYNHYVRVLLKRHLIDVELIGINYEMPQNLIHKIDFDNPILSGIWEHFHYLSKAAYNGVMKQEYVFGKELCDVPKLSMMDTIISFTGFDKDESSSFIHTTLQEYFAAIYLVNNPDSMFTEEDLKQNSNLEAVLAFYVGSLKFIGRNIDNETMNIIFSHKYQISHDLDLTDGTPCIPLTSLMLRCIYEQDSLLHVHNTLYCYKQNFEFQRSRSIIRSTHLGDFEHYICGYIVATHNITLNFKPSLLSDIEAFNKGLQSHSSINGKIHINLQYIYIESTITPFLLTIPRDIVVGLHLYVFDNVSICEVILKFSSVQEISIHYHQYDKLNCNSTMSEYPLLKLKKLEKLKLIFENAHESDFQLLKQLTAPGRPLKQLHIRIRTLKILKFIEMLLSLEESRAVISLFGINPRAFEQIWNPEIDMELKLNWCKKNKSLTVKNNLEDNRNEYLVYLIGVHSKIQLSSFTSFVYFLDTYGATYTFAVTIYSKPVTSNLSDFIKAFDTYASSLKTKTLYSDCLNHRKTQINKFMYAIISLKLTDTDKEFDIYM